jgi:hypothetical protein
MAAEDKTSERDKEAISSECIVWHSVAQHQHQH